LKGVFLRHGKRRINVPPLVHIYHEIICKALSCGGLGAFEVISVDAILDTFGSFLFRTK